MLSRGPKVITLLLGYSDRLEPLKDALEHWASIWRTRSSIILDLILALYLYSGLSHEAVEAFKPFGDRAHSGTHYDRIRHISSLIKFQK